MALCKMAKAGATGTDPGAIGEGWMGYLGKSLFDKDNLVELELSGVLSAGQAFLPGEDVIPTPGDGRTIVFATFFDAGL